jgi:hypothetical protein
MWRCFIGWVFPEVSKAQCYFIFADKKFKTARLLKTWRWSTTSFRNVGTTVTPHRTTRRHNPEDLRPLAPPLRELQIFRDAMNLIYVRIQCPSNIAQCYCTYDRICPSNIAQCYCTYDRIQCPSNIAQCYCTYDRIQCPSDIAQCYSTYDRIQCPSDIAQCYCTYDKIQCPSNIAQCYCTYALMYWPCWM